MLLEAVTMIFLHKPFSMHRIFEKYESWKKEITYANYSLHRKTSKVLFRGTVGNQSELQQGILYDKDGSFLGKYNNSKFISDPYEVFKKLLWWTMVVSRNALVLIGWFVGPNTNSFIEIHQIIFNGIIINICKTWFG